MLDVKYLLPAVLGPNAQTVPQYHSLPPALLLEVHPGNKQLLTLETLPLRFSIQHSGEP